MCDRWKIKGQSTRYKVGYWKSAVRVIKYGTTATFHWSGRFKLEWFSQIRDASSHSTLILELIRIQFEWTNVSSEGQLIRGEINRHALTTDVRLIIRWWWFVDRQRSSGMQVFVSSIDVDIDIDIHRERYLKLWVWRVSLVWGNKS